MTVKVAKDRPTLVLGPKFAGIAPFGDVNTNHGGGGGGGTGGSGGGSGSKGKWCPPHPSWTMICLAMTQMMSRFSM